MAVGATSNTPQAFPETNKEAPAPKSDPGKLETKTETLMLGAVYGDIYHPFDNTKFTVGSYKKHERDTWVDIQLAAGKLEIEK